MRILFAQIGYKNFVASMGAPYEPLLVSDRVASPPEYQKDYTENLVLLPKSFYVTEDYLLTHPEVLGVSKEQDRSIVEIANRQLREYAFEFHRTKLRQDSPLGRTVGSWRESTSSFACTSPKKNKKWRSICALCTFFDLVSD